MFLNHQFYRGLRSLLNVGQIKKFLKMEGERRFSDSRGGYGRREMRNDRSVINGNAVSKNLAIEMGE